MQEPERRRPRESIYTRAIDVTRRSKGLSPVGLYWLCLAGMSFVPCFYGGLIGGGVDPGLWAALIFFPAAQLGASALAALTVLCCYRSGRGEAFVVLARITAWTFLGVVVGSVLLMLLCGFSPLGLFGLRTL
jgi:hypothetical protein